METALCKSTGESDFIVPRGEALGAAWYLPEERQLTNREHMLDEMCATLGGRAAEEVFLTQTSTGAINDLNALPNGREVMVAYYGMSEKLPNMSYYDLYRKFRLWIYKAIQRKNSRNH